MFEDAADDPIHVAAGSSVVIPPGRHHHIVIDGVVEFALEFHREPA